MTELTELAAQVSRLTEITDKLAAVLFCAGQERAQHDRLIAEAIEVASAGRRAVKPHLRVVR